MNLVVSKRAAEVLRLFFLAVCLLLLLDAAGFAQTVSFGKAKSFTVGPNPPFTNPPVAVAVGDFNGDGKLDLAVVNNFLLNQTHGTIAIFLGAGDGTFAAAPSCGGVSSNCDVGANPVSVAVGDFDGDGKLDLAVANFGGNNVSILLGNGDGTFTAAGGSPVTVGAGPSHITVGDFNRDGKLDLAVANHTGGNVSILLGDGHGSFSTATGSPFPVGRQPVSIAVGDFNRDGILDLAVANFLDNNVSILLGVGDGTFGAAVNVIVGTQPVSVVAADFNGDGMLDLAVANQGNNNVSILLGDGNGAFPTTKTALVAKAPVDMAVGDFNGDGLLDLVTAHFPGKALSVISGKGDGTFGKGKTFVTAASQFALTVGDFNGDGKPDLAVANTKISVLLNTTVLASAGAFNTATNTAVGTGPSSVAVGDFNRNGKLDLAVANSGDDNVSILSGAGDGTFSAATGSPIIVGDQPSSVAVGDFNRDGKLDLAVANSGDDNVSVLLANGDGTFSAATPATVAVGDKPVSIAVGDFDGDGKPDIIVVNKGDNDVSILLGAGDGTFSAAAGSPITVGTGPSSVAVGDFNGDGILDLAVANSTSNNVSILLGNGDGTFTAATPATVAVGTGPSSVAIGDFDGDGNLDLAVANLGSNNVSILLGNGDGTFAAATNFAVGTAPSSIAVGDFSRDGNLDLAVTNSGSDNSVSVLLGNGAGSFTAATPATLAVGAAPSSVAVGDLNQDGKPDLAVANQTSDNVSVLLNAPTLIHVTIPNGGETWTIGTTQTIQWTSQAITGNVKIDLSLDSGGAWKTIISSTANTGSKTWKVAKPASTTARIRVCSVTFSTICDTSDADFTIQ